MIDRQCSVSSRTDQETIWPMPFILPKRGKFSRMANEANSCSPSVKAPNAASVLAISCLLSTREGLHVVVLVLHLLVLQEGLVFELRHADGIEQMAVGGDVDRLDVGERRQHHQHFGGFEHLAVMLHVAVVHLHVRLGEEAEDLGEQVALGRRSGCGASPSRRRRAALPRAANARAAGSAMPHRPRDSGTACRPGFRSAGRSGQDARRERKDRRWACADRRFEFGTAAG